MWFWKRSAIPTDIATPDPTSWGSPVAKFTNASCNIAEHFQDHAIIFDITFCGDWAGQVLGMAECVAAVQNKPEVRIIVAIN